MAFVVICPNCGGLEDWLRLVFRLFYLLKPNRQAEWRGVPLWGSAIVLYGYPIYILVKGGRGAIASLLPVKTVF